MLLSPYNLCGFMLVQQFSSRKTYLHWHCLFTQHKGHTAKRLNVFLKIHKIFKYSMSSSFNWLNLHLCQNQNISYHRLALSGRKTNNRWYLIANIKVWADAIARQFTQSSQIQQHIDIHTRTPLVNFWQHMANELCFEQKMSCSLFQAPMEQGRKV